VVDYPWPDRTTFGARPHRCGPRTSWWR